MSTKAHPSSASRRVAIPIELTFALPWHQDCYQGIVQYGDRHGWACTVDPNLAGIGPDFAPSVYDGIVGRIYEPIAQQAEQLGIPVVSARLPCDPEDQARVKHLPSVVADTYAGGQQIGEHLAQSGYRRFGFIGLENHFNDKSADGLEDALSQHGLASIIDKLTIDGHYDRSREQFISVRRKLDTWLVSRVKPIGLLVMHYAVARFAAQACAELGLRVPEDVGIVVNNGDQVVVTNSVPTLSATEFDYYQVGYEAAAHLDKLMQGKPANPMHKTIAPRDIVVRDSSDVFLTEDPLVSKAMRFIAEHIRQNPSVT